MSQIVKIEMGKRLEVIIQAAHDIQEGLLQDDYNSTKYTKQMKDIEQYLGLVKFDFEYLKNPESKVGPIDRCNMCGYWRSQDKIVCGDCGRVIRK